MQFITMSDIIVIIFIILRIVIGFIVLERARRTKLTNLYVLTAMFFNEGIGYIFLISLIDNSFLFNLIIPLNWILYLVFTDRTFYKDKKSPFLIFLAINITFNVFLIIVSGIYQFGPTHDLLFFHLGRIGVSFGMGIMISWLIYASLQSYSKIKANESVEPWIKARYLLIVLYGFGTIGIALSWSFVPIDKSINIFYFTTSLSLLILILGQYLAWVMPNVLKSFLNRNFKPAKVPEELDEEEILRSFQED